MSLSEAQLDRIVELRLEERMTQRQIEKATGISRNAISRHWHLIPSYAQGKGWAYTKERQCGRTWTVDKGPPERELPQSDERCPDCELFFTMDNSKQDDGRCLLCHLQDDGLVVTYALLGEIR